jgi:YHS domain-containing protein
MIASIRKAAFAAAFSALISASALAAGPDVNATSTGLALRGVDPVTYFTEGAPRQGDFNITAEHGGAVYRFATEENKAAFLKEPAKYAPQYGGYCAFGAAMGKKFDGDPNVWKIEAGKLYLNLAPKVADLWNADRANKIKAANEQWSAIKDKAPDELN